MGFFSTNQQDQSNKVAKQLATHADETNKEIESILSRFLKNQEKYDALSDELLVLSKSIKERLSTSESDQLYALVETVYDLQEEYLNTFRVIATLQEKQQIRANAIDDKYKKIAKKASQKYTEARSL
ncbi:hypothetical protein [Marixanthomonas ophiurae]|uniref:Uncharacterized protein n=1 Tax=Marixanthomonas ophiurae TaxID=387659 RepID=A0A3E1QC98_9FLAO|nr:hypothetical protein [Marixanthomonas ophiurae]RFN59726.1 hypothetical protein DZ858_06645 [Marixanthomonas ophiurae]